MVITFCICFHKKHGLFSLNMESVQWSISGNSLAAKMVGGYASSWGNWGSGGMLPENF